MRRLLALAGLVLCLVLAWAVPAAAQSEGDADGSRPTVLEGTLRVGFDQFFAGVEIAVADQSGTRIGRAVTDSEGHWAVAVPGAGTYRVSLDESTLPDGIGLREGFESTAEVSVTEGASRP